MTRCLAALLLAVALFGCKPEDVYVAFVPDGGGGPMRGPPCTDNTDCPPQDFCERRACGDAAGRCTHRPQLCEPLSAPVCGCDGVTYLTDCFRRAQGVTAATAGECTAGATCDTGVGCPGGAFCSRLVSTCGQASTAGRCWWVPPACPSAGAFTACAGGACLDACGAIRRETSHEPAPTLTCP